MGEFVPLQPPSPGPAAPILHRLKYTGKAGEICGIWFINLALTLLTIGTYRFWGKIRIRRYLFSQTLLRNEPFAYTGEGQEIFKGFVKVLCVIVLPVLLIWKLITIVTASPRGTAGLIGIVLLISPCVVFLIRRYRLSRSTWRCIRFQQTGSARTYAGKAIAGSLLNLITLFLYAPWNASKLFDYQINRIRFGTLPFAYTGKAADISRVFFILWGISALVYAVFLAVLVGAALAFRKHEIKFDTVHLAHAISLLAGCMLIFFLAGVCFVLTKMFWCLTLYRHVARATGLGGMTADFDASFWQFFSFKAGNFLIKLFSLGLLTPLVIHRNMKFLCRHLRLRGLPVLADIRQAPELKGSGEGFLKWIDVDALDF